ncbi:MAG TPA: hypothetical protein VLM44_07250, partial [Lutibacter sp.]|nr:hypothetical protein [Lutibacter sp.]
MTTVLTGFKLTAQNLPGTVPVLTPIGGFGVDGDAYANTPLPDIGDWFYNPLYPGSGGSLFNPDGSVKDPTRTFFLQDDWGTFDGTTFLTSTKIDMDPNDYEWGPANNLLAKDDMQNVGAHFAFSGPNETGDLWCIFAADRQVVKGDAYIDFEFLQKSLTMTGTTNGGFESAGTDGGRTVGDLLVTLIFTNGGTSAEIQIRVWEPITKGFEYVLHPNSEFAGYIFATNNLAITDVPFDVYGTKPGIYEPNQWAEGAINLTQLLNFANNPCRQLSTLFVRTKTSQSPQAELKDFPGIIQLNLGLDDFAVICPNNVTLPACSTQEQINTAFADWKAGFSYNGGVIPVTESYAYTGGAIIGSNLNTVLPPDSCGGTVSITYTATDFCEQIVSCSATFTVTPDTVAPIFNTIPQNITVACRGDVPDMINLGWTDNCDGSGSVLGTDVSDEKSCPETITRTWTYTDACGNTASAVQIITVD